MKSKFPRNYNAALSTFEKAKALRKECTPAEDFLWTIIRNRKLKGFKFRRQHPIYRFIADFYCHEALLVIELDGGIHSMKDVKEYDKDREDLLKELDLVVLRFTNEEVLRETDKVISIIEKHLIRKPS